MSELNLNCLERPPRRSGTGIPYSVVVPNSEAEGKGATRRCALPGVSAAGPQLALFGCYTSYETFRRGAAQAPDAPCLGHRAVDSAGQPTPYIFQSYREVLARVDRLAAGLEQERLTPPNADGMKLLGLYSRNRPEWVIGEQAAFAHGGVTVPMYDTLGPETVEFVVAQTGLVAVLCGGEAELRRLAAAARGGACATLAAAVTMDPVGPAARSAAEVAGLRVYLMSELEEIGAAHLEAWPHRPPSANDIATFCYTSGTTGNPKGALIRHVNMVSDAAGCYAMGLAHCTPDEVYFSYLPLPHIFERQVQVAVFCGGAPVGFWRNNPLELVADMAALRPVLMPAVPRVLNRLHDKITHGMLAAGGLKARLFVRACEAKVRGLHNGTNKHALWDRLIFAKLRAALGMDRLRLVVTGSAPIAPHVLTFMRILLGCDLIEGYGQTETCAGATITMPGDFSAGHVGGPFPCTEICLMDVPEMGYLHTDSWHGGDPREGGGGGEPCAGRGEICFRGTNVFAGYYKDPEKTAEAIDADGWLHSGDIGLWTADGALRIIDRKKNIFKLSQGEYIAPEKIENVHVQSPLVAQSFVYGDSLRSALVAVVVPDADAVVAWHAARHGSAAAAASNAAVDLEALCASAALREAVMEQLAAAAARAGLQRFERVRRVHLEPAPFTPENGLLTPTMKLKRAEAAAHYASVLDELYAAVDKYHTSHL
ncbi:long chain acyl-CoA synthetase [Tribonema minus]|uniref:Long chain acyl-CoA synthetase n=1 Tax=Tribonema minus TaxID=303371 RepID=A0A835ZFW5_9STRA|nr:long chain acyl-CoA synthetase [Tribonema minus]